MQILVDLGAVIRDSYWEFVAVKVWRYLNFFSAKNAEVISIVEVLIWIKNAFSVVQEINSSSFTVRSSFGLISDCKSLLSEIVDVKYYFSYRFENVVTHLLATDAHFKSDLRVWVLQGFCITE
uniref:RNase H type-1 domain-containing protein n=1 Tax=Manihot esculenta TaxID=3983 RepID=A0A2C9UQW5_MANES